jgi:hypothetical protein
MQFSYNIAPSLEKRHYSALASVRVSAERDPHASLQVLRARYVPNTLHREKAGAQAGVCGRGGVKAALRCAACGSSLGGR